MSFRLALARGGLDESEARERSVHRFLFISRAGRRIGGRGGRGSRGGRGGRQRRQRKDRQRTNARRGTAGRAPEEKDGQTS